MRVFIDDLVLPREFFHCPRIVRINSVRKSYQLQQAVDPEAQQSFRRIMQSARKDFGSEYWWKPGETAPERGPRLE